MIHPVFQRLVPLFLAMALAASASGLEVRLEYQKHTDEIQGARPSGATFVSPRLDCPGGDWKLPDFASAKPFFGVFCLGDSEFLYALDRSEGAGTAYDRLFFDQNGNRDLTDDPVLGGGIVPSGSDFSPVPMPAAVDLEYRLDGKTLPYSVRFYLACRDVGYVGEKQLSASTFPLFVNFFVRTNCTYTALFELQGKTVNVVFVDDDCDGRFAETLTVDDEASTAPTDRMVLACKGDRFYLACGRDCGLFDQGFVCDGLLLENKLYDLRVSPAHKSLALNPVEECLAPLKLSGRPERLILQRQSDARTLLLVRPSEDAAVPPGRYRLLLYELHRRDGEGILWRLFTMASNDTAYIDVEPGRGGILSFGEPLTPLVQVPLTSPSRADGDEETDVELELNVEGVAKEFVVLVVGVSESEESGGVPFNLAHPPSVPCYRILEAGGEMVAEGDFEQG